MAKQKWLGEIASAFGMNVSEFAEFIGYSRGGLYFANKETRKADRRKLDLAIFKLGVISEKIHAADIDRANEDYKKRIELMEELMHRFGYSKDELS